MNLFIKQKQTCRLRKQTYGHQRVKVKGRDKLGDWDQHIYTTIYKINNRQGLTVQHREIYSVLCNNLYGKESEKKQIYVYEY